MDKEYKGIFTKQVKLLMKLHLKDFLPFKVENKTPQFELIAGGLLYRCVLAHGRFAWINWMPCPGSTRYFNVYLGWTLHDNGLPVNESDREVLHLARAPVSGVLQGALDLEQIEGSNAVWGINIPSPWDQLSALKTTATKTEERTLMMKANSEAGMLSDEDRHEVVISVLKTTFDRLEKQLPKFKMEIERL